MSIAEQDSAPSPLPPTTDADSDLVDAPVHLPPDEAHSDFYGLPSCPLSIYHTGAPWPLPTGPDAQRIPKEARPVCTHPIAPVWRELGERIYKYFDAVDLKWTSIDAVRFAKVEKEPGSLFLWVGVLPGSLSRDVAKLTAARCKEILAEYEISDVEIAFRESVFTRSAAPRLLDYVSFGDPIADVRAPFTPALGLQIAPKALSYFGGTGCLYLREGGERNRVLLLTARHVVLPPREYSNDLYRRETNSTPRRDVIHFSTKAYDDALTSIMRKIGHETCRIGCYEHEIAGLGESFEGEDAKIARTRQALEAKLAKARDARAGVDDFHSEITGSWFDESVRTLGHVVYAPPISVGTADKRFMEDWALVELKPGKFDWDAFRGNVMHLGAKLGPGEFPSKMHPDADWEERTHFTYPRGGLLQLQGVVSEDELRRPATLDASGETCVLVVKNGAGTGATVGRVSGIESFVREYEDAARGVHARSTSVVLAIYAYGYEERPFAAPGDSGAVVADADGRIVGMLVGGSGKADCTDVAYASPYYFLEECIKKAFPDARLYPTPA